MIAAIALVLASASGVATAEETPAARKYQALLDEYEQEGGARLFAKRFLALAEEYPQDPVAADALLWVVKYVRGTPDTTRALELLTMHHVASEKLRPASKSIADARSTAAEKLLRAVLAKHPDGQTQAEACYYLASLLDREAGVLEQLKAQPKLAPQVLQYYGADYGKHLAALGPDDLSKEREKVYTRMLESFADVPFEDSTLGEIAKEALFAIRHLSVGKPAPEIKGEDIHGKPMKLSDFRGKVVVLTFWGHW
jgi:hypothetical protein